jgi:hypothetical protein
MDQNVSALERAFHLAGTGRYHTVDEIKRRLASEGYPTYEISGNSLGKQLRAIITKSREKPMPPDPKDLRPL